MTKEGADRLASAFARAKTCGAAKVADIVKDVDMLTSYQIGQLIRVSHEIVTAKRVHHGLLGLEGPGPGIQYPRWQICEIACRCPACQSCSR